MLRMKLLTGMVPVKNYNAPFIRKKFIIYARENMSVETFITINENARL